MKPNLAGGALAVVLPIVLVVAYSTFFIQVVDVRIRRVDLPEQNSQCKPGSARIAPCTGEVAELSLQGSTDAELRRRFYPLSIRRKPLYIALEPRAA